ncbi:MAG: putative photosynthetic complex assembly protein PuhE [Pseudomonadota bacterium]
MTDLVWPILFAAITWWATTGVLIYLDGLPRWTFKWSFAGASVLGLAAIIGTVATRDMVGADGTNAIYIAFTCGLLLWGWQETAFYMGYITGPRREPCPESCGGLRHFWHGVETVLWHQISAIAGFALLVALTWGADNQVALWTYTVLWLMQQSAKLNCFFGVRNLNLDFLPAHLKYLAAFMRVRPINAFFPVSVGLASVVFAALCFAIAGMPAGAPQTTGMVLVTTLLGLAIFEHFVLVLPIPADRLWDWSLSSHTRADAPAAGPDGHANRAAPCWSAELSGRHDRDRLRHLLNGIATGGFGNIAEVDGVVEAGGEWVRIGVRDGAATITRTEPETEPRVRAFAPGATLDAARLHAAFKACVVRRIAA